MITSAPSARLSRAYADVLPRERSRAGLAGGSVAAWPWRAGTLATARLRIPGITLRLVGWFRRGHESASDEREILVYVHQYPTELACREQYGQFKQWAESAGIHDWVFCGMSMDQDVWFITVVDATPGARTLNEFKWTGDIWDVDEEYAINVILHAQPGLADRLDYGEAGAPIRRPDGTWALPRLLR
jgi:hypothetical protein